MTAFQPAAGPAFTNGDRVQLVSADLFLTIVVFEPGDLGVILRSCDMSGLWWVAFDRDPEGPIRLPASALARSEATPLATLPPAPREPVDEPAALHELIPVMIDSSSLLDHGDAVAQFLTPLDALVPAARSRQPVLAASHAGDMRLAGKSRHLAMAAFGFLD